MTQPTEHRRGKRMAAAMWVRLGGSGTELGMGNIANASTSGAYLETAVKLPVNASITLEPLSTARLPRAWRESTSAEWESNGASWPHRKVSPSSV
jgi:hypothetical protein